MHCGAALDSSSGPSYTPEHLRERVLNTRSAVEGERKQVTVLFLDIEGSVALSSQLGPDRWHEVLERLFRVLSERVHGHEGTINQYTGDGIMALWGAPLANEHHADRACRAALAIRESVAQLAPELRATFGVELPVRIGLNSGEVVVGRIGDGLRSDYTAQGQTVGLAARMESSCEPGQIRLTEHTARLLSSAFALSPLGEIAVKGGAPVRGFALDGLVEGRLTAPLPDRGAGGRFLGRAEEIARFEAALGLARQGRGQVIGISGEAGIGKTRLCSELLARCAAQGLPTHATRCASHERQRLLSSLLPLLRSFFGVRTGDSPATARAAIAAALGSSGSEALPLVCAALEVDGASGEQPAMDPEARRRRLHAALTGAFEHAPSAVLFIDDAHWIDPASDDLLAALVQSLGRSRMLLVLNFRPEYSASFMQAEHYSGMRLSPLGREDIELLLADLAGRDASLGELTAIVHDRACGNPLFVEETLRSLAESQALAGRPGAYRLQRPLEELSVPATVQSILAARIDRLGDGPKHALQVAATIGSEFTLGLLSAVADVPAPVLAEAVAVLERAEFIAQASGSGEPDLRYTFRHPLVREVAHGSLLVQRRRPLHALIAAVLLLDEQRSRTTDAAIIAHHFEAADDAAKAAEYYRLAAQHAGYVDADQTFAYWEKVAELAARCPELAGARRNELAACIQLINLGWRRGIDRQTADRLYARAAQLMDVVGSDRLRAVLHAGYGRALSALAGSDAYLEHAEAALRFARSAGDASLVASMGSVYGQALCRGGQLEAGVRAFNDVLRAATDDPSRRSRGLDFNVTTWILLLRGHALSLLGRFDEAQSDLETCVRVADERGEIDLLVAPRLHLVELGHYRGELADVDRLAQEAVDLADRLGNSLVRVNGHIARGVACIARGNAELAEQAFRTAIDLASSSCAGMEFAPRMYRHLADALLVQGRVAEGLRAATEAVESARLLKNEVAEAQALIALAQARVHEGDAVALASAAHVLDEAAQIADRVGVRVVLPDIELARAGLARRAGNEPERIAALLRAQNLLTAMGAPARAAAVRDMTEAPLQNRRSGS
jgi:adenylate cyclase